MRKPTGPGKVRINGSGAIGVGRGLYGRLYNFDIDDDTVKIEHQDWLQQKVMPVVQACPECEIYLKGMASRSGAGSYNEGLSKRRVEAVVRFLENRGVHRHRVQLRWVGENEAAIKGKADGTESEEDRAVDILVKRLATGRIRLQRRFPGDTWDGFDPKGPTPFQMVPLNGEKDNLLVINGGGRTLVSSKPGVVQLIDPRTHRAVDELFLDTNNRFPLILRGAMADQAVILARDLDGSLEPLLDVAVLPKQEVRVTFFFMEDPKNKTRRKIGEEDLMMEMANRVFNRQANVFFIKHASKPKKVTQNLGNPVTYVTLGGSDLPFLKNIRDTSARITVFFLWDYNPDPDGDTDAEVDDFGGHVVAFEDDAGRDTGLSMAHEFAHNLGLHHRETSRELVMWPYTDQRGGVLERDQILLVNKTV